MKLNSFSIVKMRLWLYSVLQKLNRFPSTYLVNHDTRKSLTFIAFLGIWAAVTFVPANAMVHAQQISISAKNTPLNEIFKSIMKQSGYVFIYDSPQINQTRVDVEIKSASINNVLEECFKDIPFSYKIVKKNVLVKEKKVSVPETKIIAQQQQVRVNGLVVDSLGSPLSGVSVAMKNNSRIGTTTDLNGRYVLEVPTDAILIFSMIGYEPQEVTVRGNAMSKIELKEVSRGLDEVVIVGYGTQKKENLTGAVNAISGEELAKRPVMRTSAALQGLAPGVTITQRSGEPGEDGGTIRIRGVGTFGNSNPLVLIDGVEGSLDGVHADDIASISVLKDAASSSIYGSRAANGVVLITTKTGRDEKLNVTYNNYLGWQRFTELPDYVDGYTYMTKLNEAYGNMGRTPLYSEDYLQEYLANSATNPDKYADTDWQKEVYGKHGDIQNHYLSVSGGQKVNIHSSLAYQDQKGVIPGYGSKRYSLRLNARMDILDNLQGTILLSGRHAPKSSPANIDDIIIGVNRTPPIYAAQYTDGRYGPALNGFNPLAQIREGGYGRNTTNNFRSVFQVNYQPVKGVDVELSYTPHYDLASGKRFTKAIETFEYGSETPAFTVPTRSTLNQSHVSIWENTLRLLGRYEKSFGEHSFKFLAGIEQIDYSRESMNAGREGFPFPEYPVLDAGSIEYLSNSGSASEWALRSYFGRVNYDYKEKYLFEANLRIDGSSRFYEGHKWGTFPSFSAGWKLSEEDFLKDVSWISEMKLRGSWGKLGNQLIGNYPFASIIEFGQNYTYGGNPVDGGAQLTMANQLVTWESTTSSNAGLDVGLWNNKIDFAIDYYKRITSDILLELTIPALIGMGEPFQNAGKVRNTGWDFTLNYNQTATDFKYRVGVNLSDVKNEILDLKEANPMIGSYTINQEGLPINTLYGYRAIGLFQSQEEIDNSPTQIGIYAPGDIKYFDANGDGEIGSDDRLPIGNTIPRYTYGLSFDAQYKGFDLSFLIQGVGKADVLLNNDAAWAFYNAGKIKSWQLDSWTPDNRDASYPRLIAERTHNNYENSSYWVYNAAYMRLKNLQIGYTFPERILKVLPFQRLRIYATGDNLFTRHKMPEGWDPERPNGNATTYPITSTFIFGINVSL